MNERKYQLMEQYLKGEVTVSGLIDIIVELEGPAVKQSGLELAEYVFMSISEAQSVLSDLKEISNKYGRVSVADYYDLLGHFMSNNDELYGWNERTLNQAKIVAKYNLRDEAYYIEFPPVEEL